jgi:hypothetical protein
MNEAEFRSSTTSRQHLRQLINDPVFLTARSVLLGGWEAQDVPLGSPEIASVRWLSARTHFEKAFHRLDEMCSPLPESAEELTHSDFGAPEAAANLAALEKGLPPPFEVKP